MKITIFVEPTSLADFVRITSILERLEIDNSYEFEYENLYFSEEMISNWTWITMDISEYLKLKHKIFVLKNQQKSDKKS